MKIVIGSIVIVAAFFAATATAQAELQITSEPGCCSFVTGPFTQPQGEIPTYVNPPDSDALHNVTSVDANKDGTALFASDTLSAGQSGPVRGAQYLATGIYPFICTIHGASMSGDLIVDATGTPVPVPDPPVKPKVKLSIPSQKLSKVRRSGKIKIKVKGVTAAKGITVKVSKGRKKLGSISGLRLAKGASRTATVKLTKSGKKAIKKGKKITFVVKATVKGGKSVTARRTLR